LAPGALNISGAMSLPSMMRSPGSSAPINFANVGSRSNVTAISFVTPPGVILPGQRMMHGSRTPPSKC
jgi:hypothetical protein